MKKKSERTPRTADMPKEKEKAGVPAKIPEEQAEGLTVSDYGEDTGAGFEGIGQEDLLIPFLNVLQKGHAQVDEEKPGYIEGARAGMVINSVTESLYPEGINFIPVHRDHKYVEWVPRDDGGGFVGIHEPEDPMVLDAKKGGAFGKLETPEGNDLVETFYVFGLALDDDGAYTPAVIPFASTQIRAYKRWMTQMRSIQLRDPETGRRVTPPMFAHMFTLRTRAQENKKGSWHGWAIGFSQPARPEEGIGAAQASRLAPGDELYIAAREARDLVMSAAARVAYETSSEPVSQSGGASGGGGGGEGEDGDPDVF